MTIRSRLGMIWCIVGMLVLLGATLPAGADTDRPAGSDLPGMAAGAASRGLSTPQLIDRAASFGEISGEQRLVYLAYAVYEYESLSGEYRSGVPWFGTEVVQEIKDALRVGGQGKPALSASARSELARLLSPEAATVCDYEDGPSSANSANFYANYGTVGGGLTINNYLDSLQVAFATEVTSYGWPQPPYCTLGPGTCPAANPWGKYPVQVAALGGGLYGYVTVGGSYAGNVGDNPNTTPVETAAYASCMVLNQDYSTFPGGAQSNLDVTTAHEFVHAIQFGGGDPGTLEDNMWYESTAAYLEDDVHDAINDNYQFLWPQFDMCLGEYTANAYSNWLFFRYAAERNGGTNVAGGGEEIAQAFWANVALGQAGLSAYNAALGIKGAALGITYHNFAIASRFMKTCPTAAPYCYEEAAGYVASAGAMGNHGSIAAIGGEYSGSLLDNYATNWIGLPLIGPYSISFDNLSAAGQFRVSVVADTGAGLQVTPMASVVGGNSTGFIGSYSPPPGTLGVVAVVTNESQTAADPESCAANPYRIRTGTGTQVKTYLPFVARNLGPGAYDYSDDFSNPASGWSTGDDGSRTWGYLGGEYRILLKDPDDGWLVTPDLTLPADYRVEVDARQVGSNQGSYGLMFGVRFEGSSYEGYQMRIDPTSQTYRLEKRTTDGVWTTLIDWTDHAVINNGASVNRLRVDRIGDSIHLYVNGTLVGAYTESAFMGAGRDAGVRAYSYADVPVDMRFDNFSARSTTLVNPLLLEDFSVAGRWYTGDRTEVRWSYQGGEYEIQVKTTGPQDEGYWAAVRAPHGGGLVNASIEADMRFADGNLGGYGLNFGQVDWDHFYNLTVYPSPQTFGIWRWTPSGWVPVVGYTASAHINAGTATNHVKVERAGTQIKAYINGQLVWTGVDSTYVGSLSVGLYCEAPGGSAVPVSARFDNFRFSQIGPAAGRMAAADLPILSIQTSPEAASGPARGARK